MRMQVLVSTMHQTDYSLLDKMNIQTDAIVVNQCDENSITEINYKAHLIKWISLKERGVGLSRNTAWMRSDADIILFADDDLVYEDRFYEGVIKAFEENPNIDMFIFDVNIINDYREIKNYRRIKSMHRLHWYNAMRYGACRFAIRRKVMLKENISYSLMFGGGTPFGSGEDSLFLMDCFKKKLRVYAHPLKIATVDSQESTWYKGTDDKYYQDKGALYYKCFPAIYPLIFLMYSLRNLRKGISFLYSMKCFIRGKERWKENV